MLYVVLSYGTVQELPEATQTLALDGVLACHDAQGQQVRV